MNRLKSLWPDLVAVLFFVAVSFAYFYAPVSKGLVLGGHDHSGGIGAGEEMNEYRERTGERTRWTNVLFCGMPTYQLAPSYESTELLDSVKQVYQLGLPDVVMYVFIMLLGFYILLRAFDFRTWMAALGAVLWAFSSYYFIIIGAGHIWKLLTLAYIPPTLAGLVLCYRGRYLWGALLTAFFLALQIVSNHVQMSYYFLSVVGLMALAYLIEAVRTHTVARWWKGSLAFGVGALLAVCINLSNLYHTYEYSKESMRGKSELTLRADKDPADQTESGLERSYITAWSYGKGETWTLLVPNVKGGASQPLSQNKTAMEKADPTYMPIYQSLGQYWGEQPGTSGPVYVGAFVLTLFVLGLFIVRGPMKWCLLVATVLSILLSWGKNFMPFTDFFLDYVPMYAKFRTVASILVVAEFTIPFLAMLALKELVDNPSILRRPGAGMEVKPGAPAPMGPSPLYMSVAFTGGVALLFALLPDVCFGSYISSNEMHMLQQASEAGYIPAEMMSGLLNNLSEMRRAMLVSDAWRTVVIVAIGTLLVLLFSARKLSARAMVLLLLVLCLGDMWQVNKRYLNDSMFVRPTQRTQQVALTPTDELILQDTALYYRVLNFSVSTFNDNSTSYHHKSIGGYHAAKLRRYQEMVERHISPEMRNVQQAAAETGGQLGSVDAGKFSVLNMLNAKYFILPLRDGGTVPVQNPHAQGNAWFVGALDYVPTADEEITALHQMDLRREAVADERFRATLGDFTATDAKATDDSTAYIRLTKYDANALTYDVNSAQGGIAVFSEIYYPGWTATVDGEPVEIGRANYILRALRLAPGHHTVEFRFDPQSLHLTEGIAHTALGLLALAFVGLLVRSWRKK